MGENPDSVRDESRRRDHERTEHVESILADVREDLGEQSYPVSSEELATEYADDPSDLPNETESLGSVFDRMDDTFEDPRDAMQAVVGAVLPDEALDPEGVDVAAETARWDEETYHPGEETFTPGDHAVGEEVPGDESEEGQPAPGEDLDDSGS